MLTERFWLRMRRVYDWQKRLNFIQCILARWLINLRNPFPYRLINCVYFDCITPQLYVIYRTLLSHSALKNHQILNPLRAHPHLSRVFLVANHSKLVWRLVWCSTAMTRSRMFSSNPAKASTHIRSGSESSLRKVECYTLNNNPIGKVTTLVL